MVFHGTDNDFIAFFHEGFAKAEGKEVHTFGGASREDDFGVTAGSYKPANGLSGCFVQFGGLLGEEVNTPVDIGVHRVILIDHGLNHLTGLLGCCPIV